jgi:hypothetical protein
MFECPFCNNKLNYDEHPSKCPKCKKDLTDLTFVPNDLKTPLDKWIPLNTEFQIKKARLDTEENLGNRMVPYEIQIKIPHELRRGWYPKDVKLVSVDENGKQTGYDNHTHDIPKTRKDIQRLLKLLRDYKRWNQVLQKRNRKLEKYFSRTAYDEERERWNFDKDKFDCEYCGLSIDTKKDILGKDFGYLMEEGGVHVKCAFKMFNSLCSKCHILWCDDDLEEGNCGECGGEITQATEKDIEKFFLFDAIKKYMPKELQDKVILKPGAKTK